MNQSPEDFFHVPNTAGIHFFNGILLPQTNCRTFESIQLQFQQTYLTSLHPAELCAEKYVVTELHFITLYNIYICVYIYINIYIVTLIVWISKSITGDTVSYIRPQRGLHIYIVPNRHIIISYHFLSSFTVGCTYT